VFRRVDRLSRAAVALVLRSGRRRSSPHFTAIVSDQASGYAVIVPKKVIRGAVARHRLKRVIREALKRLPLPQALVVIVRAAPPEATLAAIQSECATLLPSDGKHGTIPLSS
jgi:ribonuclease P protein component